MNAYPCPFCGGIADLTAGCPECGRPPDPDAAEVIRLDGEIARLARHLREAQQRRTELASRVSAAVLAERVPPPAHPPPVARASEPASTAEASVATVQNVLFILGGLLLGTAAVVFTAVAWATFGVTGRATILAVVTGLALGAPLLAQRRGLTATAETFAAVGLLLVVLDGYAAWYVDLFGLADSPARRYAAGVCAVTAVVAAGYAALTRLAGPRYAALVVAQPILPLLAADTGLGPAGWAGVFLGIAALDLAVVASWRGGAQLAWTLYGLGFGAGLLTALGALAAAGTPAAAARAGAALVAAGTVLLAGALAARSEPFRAVAAGALVVLVAVAAVRFVALAWPQWTLVLAAGTGAALAAAVRALPVPVRPGPRAGALLVAGALGFTLLAVTLDGWFVRWFTGESTSDWRLPAAVLLTAGAVAVLVPRADRHDVAVAAGALVVLGLPAAFPLAWPALTLIDAGAVAVAMVAAALAGTVRVATVRWLAAVALGVPLIVDIGPSLWAVLGAPYGWLGAIWSGAPTGAGLSPSDRWTATGPDALALAVVAVAAGLAAWAKTPQAPGPPVGAKTQRGLGRRGWQVAAAGALPAGCAAVLVALAAAAVPWPAVPATSLLLGLACGLAGALAPRLGAVVGPLSVVLTGAGLAGSLPTEAATLTALGLTVVAAGVAGAAGRTTAARVTASPVAAAAAVLTAATAGLAADLPLRGAAFAVLGAAGAVLAVSAALSRRGNRRWDAVAAEAAAHAGAVVGLLLTAGWARYAAGVATLWGIAVGLRALLPGEAGTGRRVRAAAAAGCELFAWWMLLAAAEVALVEAYTLPAAVVALFAGWLAVRGRPALSSWIAYGPALAAASLPSLASVLVAEGEPLRRLLLGAGGLAAVMAGAIWRLQAPVVVGGGVVGLVALHELVVFWDLLPRWIPLAAGGLLLVGLAMTYERRRRDVARLREAVGRMT